MEMPRAVMRPTRFNSFSSLAFFASFFSALEGVDVDPLLLLLLLLLLMLLLLSPLSLTTEDDDDDDDDDDESLLEEREGRDGDLGDEILAAGLDSSS